MADHAFPWSCAAHSRSGATPHQELAVDYFSECTLVNVPAAAAAPLGLMDGLGLAGKDTHSFLCQDPCMDFVANSPVNSTVSTDAAFDARQALLDLSSLEDASSCSQPSQLSGTAGSLSRKVAIKSIFSQFTCYQKDTMAVADLGMALRFLKHNLSGTELQKVTEETDQDGGGTIDLDEFTQTAERLDARRLGGPSVHSQSSSPSRLKPSRDDELREIFFKFAAAGQSDSLVITKAFLGSALRFGGHSVTDEEADSLFAESDDDGGGELDFDEFRDMMNKLDEGRGITPQSGSTCRLKLARVEELREIFFKFASEDVITSTLLGGALCFAGHSFDDTEVLKLFSESDDDGGGELDVDEFLAMVGKLDDDAIFSRQSC